MRGIAIVAAAESQRGTLQKAQRFVGGVEDEKTREEARARRDRLWPIRAVWHRVGDKRRRGADRRRYG